MKSLRRFTKHIRLRLVGMLLVVSLLLLSFVPMFSGTVVKAAPIFSIPQTVSDSSIELGTSTIKQAGAEGTRKITYSQPRSLFDLIFNRGTKDKLTEKSSTVTKQPIPEIIGSGTIKYQYMYCSNGSYRYYTNTQFQDPDIGFTHKSPDSCAQNNQGTETQLANTPPRTTTTDAPASIAPLSTFTVPNCTTTSIPYGIDYQSVSWLPTGQTETFAGLNGTYFSCLGTTVQPLDEIIYEGDGQNYDALAEEEAASAAKDKCTEEYNSAMAQIDAAGAAGSSATFELQAAYNECLEAAG